MSNTDFITYCKLISCNENKLTWINAHI